MFRLLVFQVWGAFMGVFILSLTTKAEWFGPHPWFALVLVAAVGFLIGGQYGIVLNQTVD